MKRAKTVRRSGNTALFIGEVELHGSWQPLQPRVDRVPVCRSASGDDILGSLIAGRTRV